MLEKFKIEWWIVIVVLAWCEASDAHDVAQRVKRDTGEKKIFCYYSSTAEFRQGAGKFTPEDINPELCTHVIFAFANINNGVELTSTNWNDMGPNGLYKRTLALKKKNPYLKVLLSVGGWTIGSKPFTPVIRSKETMRRFAINVVRFLRKHHFDGFDMDWEFPGVRGSEPDDKYRFTTLLQILQTTFQREATRARREKLILVLAAAGGTYFIEKSYEPEKIVQHVDYILLMAYNYYGSWFDVTGLHSGIYPRSDEKEGEREWNQAWTVDFWMKTGCPKDKIILGIPTYGMSFTLADPADHGVRAPTTGVGERGKYTREEGILSYYEICENLQNGWHSVWQEEQKVPYSYKGDQWVGHENVKSVAHKARFIRDHDLGGAFIWSVELDDFGGHCRRGKYPLLSTIARILRDNSYTPTTKKTVVQPQSSKYNRDMFLPVEKNVDRPASDLAYRELAVPTVHDADSMRSGMFGEYPVRQNEVPDTYRNAEHLYNEEIQPERYDYSDQIVDSYLESDWDYQDADAYKTTNLVENPDSGAEFNLEMTGKQDQDISLSHPRQHLISTSGLKSDKNRHQNIDHPYPVAPHPYVDKASSKPDHSRHITSPTANVHYRPSQYNNFNRPPLSEESQVADKPTVAQSWQYNSDSECKQSGLFPHPDSRESYIICVRHGTRWHSFHLRCPKTLLFKPDTATCGYKEDYSK